MSGDPDANEATGRDGQPGEGRPGDQGGPRKPLTVDDDIFRPRLAHRSLRRFPNLIGESLRLTYQASPALFALVTALDIVRSAGVAGQLLLGKAALDITLRPGQTTAGFGRAVPELVGLLAITVGLSFAQAIQVEQARVQAELVSRLAIDRVLDVAGAVELSAFESPDFFDQLQRALINGSDRPYQMVTGLTNLVTSGLTIVGICVVILTLVPVVLPVALVAYFPLWVAMTRNSRAYYRFMFEMTKLDRQRYYLLRVLTGRPEAKEIRAFRLAPLLRQRYDSFYDRYLAGLRQVARLRIKRSVLASLSTSGLTVAVLGLLGYLYLGHHVSLPAAATSVAALLQLSSQLQSFLSGAASLYEGSLFLDNYRSFVTMLPAVQAARPTRPAPAGFETLAVDHVSFSYPGTEATALREVSIEVRAGEIVALVGANGSGKTTLAKILANLYTPTSGRVLWDGADTAEMDPEAIRQSVAVIFQDFVHYLMTAHDNIAAGRFEASGDTPRVAAAAAAADAEGFITRLPDGYESLLGKEFEGGCELSIGQWQRVALARAFFRQAPFVILDEPTSALDPRAESDLFDHIRSLLSGRSVLLISHRFSSVRSADRIYVLDQGEVVEQGSHDDLMAANGLYAELFTLQASAYLDGPLTARGPLPEH